MPPCSSCEFKSLHRFYTYGRALVLPGQLRGHPLRSSLVQSGFTAIASFRARSYTARKLRELTLDSPQLFHVKHNFGYEKGACFT